MSQDAAELAKEIVASQGLLHLDKSIVIARALLAERERAGRWKRLALDMNVRTSDADEWAPEITAALAAEKEGA